MDSESDDESKPLLTNATCEDEMFKSNHRNLYLSCGAMLFGSLSVGTSMGMSSPMIPSMQKDETNKAIEMTSEDYTWFGSLLSLGAIVGGFAGGFVMQYFGRKLSAMLCGVPFVGGMLMIAYASSVLELLVGRLLCGIAVGAAILIAPTYLSETSTESMRGFWGSASQLTVNTGILLTYAIGDYMHWRWLALLAAVPCTTWTILSLFIPESPRFLLIKHNTVEAKKSLIILRGKFANVDRELESIEENIRMTSHSASWTDVLRQKSIRIPLLLTLAIAFFRQWNGQQCLLYYSKSIFEKAGLKTENQQNIATITVAAVEAIFTIVPLFFVDKFGRKILLMASGILVAFGAATFGLYLQLTQNSSEADSPDLGWIAVASMMVYIAGFSVGLGPVFWLLVSEIIPMRARGKASSLATSSNWFFGFLLTKEFFNMQDAFTQQGTFWMFSVISVIGVIFYRLFIPETKGKTLEEISMYFKGVHAQTSQ